MSTKSNSSSINSRKSSNESNDEHEKASLNISKASNSNIMTVTASNEENLARLCHLKKWPHFQGYGFNLHAERSKMGQHIGKVDLDSPADLAGLKEGDRIIEVNNVNISNENHQQVVKRIRNGLEVDGVEYPDQVILLVVDSKADEYYKKLNVVPKNDMKNIIKLVTPGEQPPKPNEKKQEINVDFNNENISQRFTDALKTQSSTPAEALKTTDESSHSNLNEKERKNSNTSNSSDSIVKTSKHKLNSSISSNSNKSANSISKEQMNYNKDNHKSNPIETQNEQRVNKNIGHKENSLPISSDSFKSSKLDAPISQNKTSSNITPQSSLSSSRSENNRQLSNNITNNKSQHDSKDDTNDPYKMSAADYRNYLKSKGRSDPRLVQVDMKQKYEIFQNM